MDWIILSTIICVILCFLISGAQVKAHVNDYHNPHFQKRIIVILLMPPIYTLFSSLAIWLHDHKSYLLFVRDIYESIVIYNFFQLLKAYIGYNDSERTVEDTKVHERLAIRGGYHHSFPVNLWKKPVKIETHEEGKNVLEQWEKGVLQYIPIKIICAVIDVLDLWAWFWAPGNNLIYHTCSLIVSVSVSVALYYLVLFFHTLHKELHPYNPLMKFLTIKGVLFLTFWQEIVLWIFAAPLAHSRFIPEDDREDASEAISSVLVNIEMVIMTLLTAYAYSHKDFVQRKKTMNNTGFELLANEDTVVIP